MQKPIYDLIRTEDSEVDFGEDDSGLTMTYRRRGSGYYIDVGASELIADGSARQPNLWFQGGNL